MSDGLVEWPKGTEGYRRDFIQWQKDQRRLNAMRMVGRLTDKEWEVLKIIEDRRRKA